MKVSLSQNKKNNFISIDFYKIDYKQIVELLNILNIDFISLFIDKMNDYWFYKRIKSCEFFEYASKLNESLLIFDGEITECKMDDEIQILLKSKILIGVDLGEKYTNILINNKNNDIIIDEIKKIFK